MIFLAFIVKLEWAKKKKKAEWTCVINFYVSWFRSSICKPFWKNTVNYSNIHSIQQLITTTNYSNKNNSNLAHSLSRKYKSREL